jgi:hypothetical protein
VQTESSVCGETKHLDRVSDRTTCQRLITEVDLVGLIRDGGQRQTCCAHLGETKRKSWFGEPSTWARKLNVESVARLVADLTAEVFKKRNAEGDCRSDHKGGAVLGCSKLKQLDAFDDLGRPGAAPQQVVGWARFHHGVFILCIFENNN